MSIKNELRKKILTKRMALPDRVLANKSTVIIKTVLKMREYQQAGQIMAYVDFRKEVKTGEFIIRAIQAGKKVSIPKSLIEGREIMPALLLDYPADLAPGAYGILEPHPDCLRPVNPLELDIVIIPGVAFDKSGNRLGYGGGYYDRFLMRTRKDCIRLALAFEFQIQADLPADRHDVPVHIIVTEERLIRCV